MSLRVALSPRSGDQKIFGSLPCPKRVITDHVVVGQPQGGSRHRSIFMLEVLERMGSDVS
jgi:hypothetical protein